MSLVSKIQDLATAIGEEIKAVRGEFLSKTNTTAFTPDADYEPATKKYVDDNAGGTPTVPSTAKTTPVDADVVTLWDSAASWARKKGTWSNIKATLKTYFDTLYATIAQAKGVIGINDQTGTAYTLVLTDAGKLVRCNNAGAITLTVPPNTSVAFPVNTVITVEQKGAGQITVTPGSGVTCNAFDGLLSAGQYAGLSLIKVDTNVWTVFGGISA